MLADARNRGRHFLSATGRMSLAAFARQFPPWRTVYQWFCTLRDDGVFESLNHHLVRIDRIRTGREPAPSAAVIDSKSVKRSEGRRVGKGSVRKCRYRGSAEHRKKKKEKK